MKKRCKWSKGQEASLLPEVNAKGLCATSLGSRVALELQTPSLGLLLVCHRLLKVLVSLLQNRKSRRSSGTKEREVNAHGEEQDDLSVSTPSGALGPLEITLRTPCPGHASERPQPCPLCGGSSPNWLPRN